jgi:hypothetical protein
MKNTDEKPDSESMNYNDRLDGYGFGEAESMDTEKEYEKDPHFTKHCIDLGEGYRKHRGEPFTRDEYGLRNQYGPVDQYVFRSYHLLTRVTRNNTEDVKKLDACIEEEAQIESEEEEDEL